MRWAWSARRVFVVVAAAWFAMGFVPTHLWYWSLGIVLHFYGVERASHLIGQFEQSRIGAALVLLGDRVAYVLGFPVAQLLVKEVSLFRMRSPMWDSVASASVLDALLIGANALAWAALITIAYVLIRRVRDRRAASREA